jgi:putative DNA primase/helicase
VRNRFHDYEKRKIFLCDACVQLDCFEGASMSVTKLPSEITNRCWARVQELDSVPLSERLNGFRVCAHDLARIIGNRISPTEIGDCLREYAIKVGVVGFWGEDAVQAILAEVLKFEATKADDQIDAFDARPPEFSDEALALRFAERFSHKLKYVALWNKWFIYTGTHWVSDDTLQVTDLARDLCREVANNCFREKIAVAVASKKTVTAVISLARADRRIAANSQQWDSDPWLLNTPAGAIDLRTGTLRAHDPNDYCTKMTAVAPDSLCPTPIWSTFLKRVCRGDAEFISFLQRILGYALTGVTREHALFFCYGTGANGKSTLINIVVACIGDYHRTAAIETFTASKIDRHPTDLAGLRGARLVTAVETEEGRRWDEAKIKALTGGDKIAARFMRQDFFEFNPNFKLLLAGNHKPGLRSVDEAIRRRFHLLPFLAIIPPDERDDQLGEKLKAERPGILAWMIQGCLDWQRRGLEPPEVVKAATAEYLEAEDALAAWKREAGDADPNAFELSTDLYASWKIFCQETGEFAGTQKKFSGKLDDRGASFGLRKGRNSTGNNGFYGLRLRSNGPKPTNADEVSA